MVCLKCGSDKINVSVLNVNKRYKYNLKDFVFILNNNYLVYLLLLPIIGWAFLLLYYIRGYKITEETWSVCQNCGERWKI